MCGIVGLVRTDGAPVEPGVLRAMTDTLRHRGPDGDGVWIEGAVALGHRRLAIIDLEGGRQPMSNEDGRVWLTCNGEIYNYQELRQRLQGLGHRFRTASDSEVILHAYEEWREDCVTHLRGMFAFAIADTGSRTLFLARDHLGIKPLYIYSTPGVVAFASELQALMHLSGFDLSIDLRAIDQYLRLGYIPSPRTSYQHIAKLPPGNRVIVGFDSGVGPFDRYWQPAIRPARTSDPRELEEMLDDVLRESIRSHLVADVPYGALLSGGVDSSAVVSYMVEALGKTFPVFTIGFEETGYSEVAFARAAADRWGLEHHVEILTPNALEILPLLVRHYGEPFADSSAIPTFFVSRLSRQSVPMVLSGDGGDEFFLGYENYSRWLWWLDFDGAHPVKNWLRPLARTIRPQRYPRREPSLANWLDFVSLMPTPLRQSLWREPFRSVALLEVEAFAAAAKQVTARRPATMAALADRLTYLPEDILNKVDVASMAHGLEVRTPLVDLRVAEFAASLPERVNIERVGGRRWEGKLLLKRLLRRYLPEDHIRRPKQGFSIPIDDWFRSGTPLRKALEERIHDRQSILNQILDSDTVHRVVEGRHGYRKWQLLVLDEWARQCPKLALPSAQREQAHEADLTG